MEARRPTFEVSLNLMKDGVDGDHPSGSIPAGDPDPLQRAIRAKHNAQLEYLRVLEIYEEFMARGNAACNGYGAHVHGTSVAGGSGDSAPDVEEA